MTEITTLPLERLVESPFNARRRFDPEAMSELTRSIQAQGVLQPILVRPFQLHYQIIAGARRFRAATASGLETIPVVVREMDDRAALECNITENLQREDVHPIEEAEGYERLMKEADYTADQIADKVGKSRSYAYARLKLLDLCLEARDAFYEGKLDASTALLVARIPGKVLQKKAVKDLVNGYGGQPMSFRMAKEHVRRNFMLNLKEATFRPGDAKLVAEAGSCTDCPKRTGNNPELFDDVDNAHVCTDPACFDNKREAHYLKLKENAEKKGIKVIQGEEAKKIMPHGQYSIRGDFVSLDSIPDGDDRTYRDILGKDAPVAALIENNGYDRNKIPLIEVAEETALEAALKKAGWVPREDDEDNDGGEDETPEERADREQRRAAQEAERKAKEHAREVDKRWRVKLFELVREKNAANLAAAEAFDTGELLCLTSNFLRQLQYIDGHSVERVAEMWGYAWDENQDEDANIAAFEETITRQMDTAALCQLLFDVALIDEAIYNPYSPSDEAGPTRLIAEARRHGIDPEAIKAEIEAELQPAEKPAPKTRKKTKGASPANHAAQTGEETAEKEAA